MDKETRRLKYSMDRVTDKVCELCGTVFTTTRGNKRFCSYPCSKKASRPKVQEHRCPMCGDITGNRQTYCSDECQEIHHNNWVLYNYRLAHPLVEKRCKWCGTIIYSTTRKFCSDKCAHLSMLEDRKYNPAVKEASKRNTVKRQELKHMDDLARHREEALKKQEELLPTAVKKDMPNPDRYLDTLGIRILGSNFLECVKCGYKFVVGTGNPDKGGMHTTLKYREASGRSPCPNCSDWPYGHKQFGMTELEIQKLFPEFSVMHWRPEWLDGKEIDLYAPEFNVALEYDGVKWHSGITKGDRKKYASKHIDKTNLCEKHCIQLIHLFETEWLNSRDCVIDKLSAIFHRPMERYMARKCYTEVVESGTPDFRKSRDEIVAFLNRNHIQGAGSGGTCRVMLRDNKTDELRAVCCFQNRHGRSRTTEDEWDLCRYATSLGTSVIGGISKCISAFKEAHPECTTLTSLADRRWTSTLRSAYSSSGFEWDGKAPVPDYFYVVGKGTGIHLANKSQYQLKSIDEKFPDTYVEGADNTEWARMERAGVPYIYDCGKLKYYMRL